MAGLRPRYTDRDRADRTSYKGGVLAATDIRIQGATLPPACESLRQQVRAFVADAVRDGLFQPGCDRWLGGFDPDFSRHLGQRGWLGMTWPKEFGGHERSALERFVVTEELLAAGAPVAAHWVGDRQTGPTLLRYGTAQQKREILPHLASGERFFAIGMSEPGSGSDLASVRTQAERIDGGWVVNGTKIWTSNAHRSHYFIILCRTAPRTENRHAGLSQLIIDLTAPGLDIRPIPLLTGAHHFNEVVMKNVEVPHEMVVGEIGNGWQQVTSELAYERSGPERFLSTLPLFSAYLDHLAGRREIPVAQVAAVIGRLAARLAALRAMSVGIAAALDRGEAPEIEAALVKDLGTRFESELTETVRELHDCRPDLQGAELERLFAQAILHAPGFTLRGGTNEILRGVVARGLGLR